MLSLCPYSALWVAFHQAVCRFAFVDGLVLGSDVVTPENVRMG